MIYYLWLVKNNNTFFKPCFGFPFFFADRKSEPLLRPDAKDHSQADKKDKLSAKSKSSAVDSFLQQSTAAIGEGCRQQQSLTTHNKILLLILFLLVHWVLNIV